jgi:hypothetical protein
MFIAHYGKHLNQVLRIKVKPTNIVIDYEFIPSINSNVCFKKQMVNQLLYKPDFTNVPKTKEGQLLKQCWTTCINKKFNRVY